MNILFYGTKNYDEETFTQELFNYPDIHITFTYSELDKQTIFLSKHFDAVCIFVNCILNATLIHQLKENGIHLILLRCAGFNNIDLLACKKENITVMRVNRYSPNAVAEMAMALALAVNRKIHKAYIKVRENNFSLTGLTGIDFYHKTVGIVGLGKIGLAFANICKGFEMKVLAYDPNVSNQQDFIEFVSFKELLKRSDIISLHCPLNKKTHHLIDKKSIHLMKNGVILVNTSRGGLIKTEDLIQGIRKMKFSGVALDVYEEEDDYVFENLEEDILMHSITARLLSFPNVIVTSHQGFLTKEALQSIAKITLANAKSFQNHQPIQENIVSYD